jgi:hypothetical protein
MAAPIKITVKGTRDDGLDAPTVEDLIAQIQDFVSVLQGVETAIAEGRKAEIVWRVTKVTTNSPVAFELTPCARQYGMDIDNRAKQVVVNTSLGFQTLANSGERPAYFTDAVITKAERVYKRVTNGLAETTIDFSGYDAVNPISISKQDAMKSIKHIAALKSQPALPYRELGSAEGYITKVEKDGHHRPIVWIRTRLDDQEIKCVANGDALSRIGLIAVERVWEGIRVRVFGELHYKALGKLEKIAADTVQFFEDDAKLPALDAIVDPNFAAGVESVEYLRRLRENDSP